MQNLKIETITYLLTYVGSVLSRRNADKHSDIIFLESKGPPLPLIISALSQQYSS